MPVGLGPAPSQNEGQASHGEQNDGRAEAWAGLLDREGLLLPRVVALVGLLDHVLRVDADDNVLVALALLVSISAPGFWMV